MDRRGWLATAVGGMLAWPGAAHAHLRKPWPAKRATPTLRLPMMDGSSWTLEGERGHPVLLNFWASWCEPCRTEMPSLEQLAATQRDTGLRVLAVNYRESNAAVSRFLTTTPLSLPVLRDVDGSAARAFGITIFPSTVAIDSKGQARFVIVGEADWAALPNVLPR